MPFQVLQKVRLELIAWRRNHPELRVLRRRVLAKNTVRILDQKSWKS